MDEIDLIAMKAINKGDKINMVETLSITDPKTRKRRLMPS